MVFDRPKWDGFKNSSYSRKFEYDNGQIESFGNEQRLLSPTKNLSIHPRNSKMLSKSGYVYFEKEPIIEKVCINRLAKNRIPYIITSSNFSDSENLPTKDQKRF
jgi:hypothetical protein